MKPALLLLALVAVATPARSAAGEPAPTQAQKYFTDTKLIDKDGKTMRLYSDLIRGRSVVIDTFFTTCTSICPRLNKRMADIQGWLGDRLGKDVYLISISVDPEHDTPPRLVEYAKRSKARPGWYFLTGPRPNVDFVLRKLGHFIDSPDDHTSIFLVGNDRTELWKKVQGFANAKDVIAVVQGVIDGQ
jgi:protein SCO1/2